MMISDDDLADARHTCAARRFVVHHAPSSYAGPLDVPASGVASHSREPSRNDAAVDGVKVRDKNCV